MTSFARFYNLQLNMYDVIGDVPNRLKKSEINIFLKIVCKHHNPIYCKKINKKFKFQLNMHFKMLLPWQNQTP